MPSSTLPRSSGESHVRATIVECEDAPAVVDDEDGTIAPVHNEPPFRLQLLKAPRKREFLVRRVHEQAYLSWSTLLGSLQIPDHINIGILSRKRDPCIVGP